MSVGDIYEVRFEGMSSEVERWNQVWHFEKTVEAETDLYESSLALADALGAEFGGSVLSEMSDAWNLLSTRANRVWPTIGVPALSLVGIGSGGFSGSEPLPADIAAVLSLRTASPGARFRGRKFVGGLVEGHQAAGVITPTSAASWLAQLNNIYEYVAADAVSNEWRCVVFSRAQVTDSLTPVSAPVVRAVLDKVLRNMRPRSTTLQQYVGL